jgi:hypothetical protein
MPTPPHAAVVMQNRKWANINDPKLVEKNLRFAESVSRAHGDVAPLEEFDLASAAFPNPSPIIAATWVLVLGTWARDKAGEGRVEALCRGFVFPHVRSLPEPAPAPAPTLLWSPWRAHTHPTPKSLFGSRRLLSVPWTHGV